MKRLHEERADGLEWATSVVATAMKANNKRKRVLDSAHSSANSDSSSSNSNLMNSSNNNTILVVPNISPLVIDSASVAASTAALPTV